MYKAFKQEVRKYYKYQYSLWTQPVLTADGTLGGGSFACAVSGTQQGSPYYGLDNNSSTTWRGNSATSYFIFYNPTPIKVTQLDLVQFSGSSYNYWTTSGTIYGSNDNSTWTSITTYTNSSKDFTIDMSSNTNLYKYYKIQSETSTYRFALTELTITAYTREIIDGTSTDYDFYKDVDEYKETKTSTLTYHKTVEITTTGDTDVAIPADAKCNILLVGAGGGAARGWWWDGGSQLYQYWYTGGNGHSYQADFAFDSATTITVTVGAGGAARPYSGGTVVGYVAMTGDTGGASSIKEGDTVILTCNGGNGGYSYGNGGATGANGSMTLSVTTTNVTLDSYGYESYGKGVSQSAGTNGYAYIHIWSDTEFSGYTYTTEKSIYKTQRS